MTRHRLAPNVAGAGMAGNQDRVLVESLILELLSRRTPPASICPSEVARAISHEQWRQLMPLVRSVACRLAAHEVIEVTQGLRVLSPMSTWRGPIRLRRGARFTGRLAAAG